MYYPNFANFIFKASLILVLLCNANITRCQPTVLRPLDTLIKIDKMILERFISLNKSYRTNFKIFKTAGPTRATRALQVEVNTQGILEQSRLADDNQLSWIVTLTITHEFYHLLQYRYYVKPFNKYEFKILESQADLLSGVYLLSAVLKRSLESQDSLEKATLNNHGKEIIFGSAFQQAYRFFFNIGTNTYSLADHPSREQRATSICRGALYGYNINMGNRVYNNLIAINKAKNSKAEEEVVNEVKSSIQKGLRKLNIDVIKTIEPSTCGCYDSLLNLKQLMDWSYDHAKLIVHGNTENLVDIIRSKLEIDNYKLYPKAVVKSTFKNIGNDTLIFVYESRLGRNTNDTLATFEDNFFFSSNSYHKIFVFPHRSVTVRDTFALSRNSSTVISPPSELSLFYCDKTKAVADRKIDKFSFNQVTSDKTLFPIYLDVLMDALNRSDYSKVVANMGTYLDDFRVKKKELKYDGLTPPNLTFNCLIERNIINEKKSKINLQLGIFRNYRQVDSIYYEYKGILNSLYSFIIEENHLSSIYKYSLTNKELLEKEALTNIPQMDRISNYSSYCCNISLHSSQEIERYPGNQWLKNSKEIVHKVYIVFEKKNNL